MSSTDLAQIAGITYRQLDLWTKAGILTPVVPSDGPGNYRGWTVHHARVACALGRLALGRAQYDALGSLARALDATPALFGERVLVSPAGRVVVVGLPSRDDPEIAWLVDLLAVAEHVELRCAERFLPA